MSYDLNADGSIDRGENPKNPGDRGFGHGDQVTLEYNESPGGPAELEAGYFVNFDGEGGVYRPEDDVDLTYDGILKHDAEDGELVTVHVRGAIRSGEYPAHDADGPAPELDAEWPVITALDDDDYLIALR